MQELIDTKSRVSKIRAGFGWVALVATLAVFSYLYVSQKFFSSKSATQTASQDIIAAVASKLPVSDEYPALEEVRTPETLRLQNPYVFQKIEKGDFLLKYHDRLIIYRPSTDAVIGSFPFVQGAK